MAWTYSTKLGSWIGLAADAKPTTQAEDDIGYEYDTQKVYISKLGSWLLYKDNVSPVSGTVTATGITGTAAHDATGTANPVRIAARAANVLPTAVSTTGDVCNVTSTMHGAIITKPFAIPEAEWSFACTTPVVNTTDVVLKAAGAAGIKNYITAIQVKNTNAVATEIVIKDGSTVIWRGHVNASMPQHDYIEFPTPLKTTAATALNFACITTAANVYLNAQGFQAA